MYMVFLISGLLFWIGFYANGLGSETVNDPKPEDRNPIRVMSFNIRYGTANDGPNHWDKRKEFLAETIATFGPDLLGTQETLADQRNFLKTKLVGYDSFGVGRDDGKDNGEMAALFYRSTWPGVSPGCDW